MISRYVLDLMDCACGSFINHIEELILDPKTNLYIVLRNIRNERQLKAAVIEWCTRSACGDSERPGKDERRIADIINRYLKTDFNSEEFSRIYEKLGNGHHHRLTYRFIDSGYDLSVLD